MRYLRAVLLALVTLTLCSCATVPAGRNYPRGTQTLAGCPPEHAVAEPAIDKLYADRTWKPPTKLSFDTATFADTVRVPVNDALVKLIGPDHASSLDSLATARVTPQAGEAPLRDPAIEVARHCVVGEPSTRLPRYPGDADGEVQLARPGASAFLQPSPHRCPDHPSKQTPQMGEDAGVVVPAVNALEITGLEKTKTGLGH